MLHRRNSVVAALLCFTLPALAFKEPTENSRFDRLAIDESRAVIGVVAVSTRNLPEADPLRAGWEQFATQNGGWQTHLDLRSGMPTLSFGAGIRWFDGAAPPIDQLAEKAEQFLEQHRFLLGDWRGQLVLDRNASGPMNERTWQITFRQQIDSVPVQQARLDFHIVEGKLVAFGAHYWGSVEHAPITLGREAARARLDAYLGISDPTEVIDLMVGTLEIRPIDPAGQGPAMWTGPRGRGLGHRAVWRFLVQVPGEMPQWMAEVDASTGEVVNFFDNVKYEQVRGGIFPLSNDGIGPEGIEQPNFPMPFADYSENGGADQFAGDQALYSCSAIGNTMSTNLQGPYIRVIDVCGAINETASCDDPIDLELSPGTDCAIPPGSSAGNTHAARSSFYHLNRVMEKGRAWLPNNNWLRSQIRDQVNVNATCNATYGGSQVNFYKSGGGCRNTGELQGVFVHEWGHGIDENDGGGFDNPSEAYADIVAVFESRLSCVGRGFYMSQQCGGYGNACLNCTGIRDQDWDARANHTPSTPGGFIQNNCGGGSGPCGKETHCEGYLSAEAIYDLARRDLPAMGIDQDSAWQLAERLWFQSRPGSGGNAYNCALPNADGCGTNSWFHKLRVADDNDGNLNNGTPHAAAIFAAFNRHGIACGTAGDAANQNSGGCPTLAKPVITQTKGLSNSVELTWGAVSGASRYRILRNDLGCSYAQIIVGDINSPAVTFVDDNLANEQPVYYRVQAIGSNSACESPVSSCVQSAGQPLAGTVRFDQATYSCSRQIGVRVKDSNIGSTTTTVQVWSTSEPTRETITLTQIAPGSPTYQGTITSTSAPAVNGDGRITIVDGDTLFAEYIDANDGNGGINVPRNSSATADCVLPSISAVGDSGVTDVAAQVHWQTNETSNTVLRWGPVRPPANTTNGNPATTQHSVQLSGLQACTVYWYEVQSTDPAGNTASSNNGGQYFNFETLGDFGEGLQPCHRGRVTIDDAIVSCNDTVTFHVIDIDLNLNPSVAETVILSVTSSTETTPELVVATETGPNTSRFNASIQTNGALPTSDGIVQTQSGDTLTVTYRDADDGTGVRATSYDVATLDCAGPTISALNVINVTNHRATISFNTNEPGDTVIEWGTTPALGNTSSNTQLVTAHNSVLNQFNQCQRVHFRVRSSDIYGNQTVRDNNGQPFSFDLGLIPGVFFHDSFENGLNGWTLQGEWQIDTPQGRGTTDPSAAYNNSKVLGHDLTGLGANPGNYEPNISIQSARSPSFNATTWQQSKLILYRRLSVEPNDDASLWIFSPAGLPLYRSNGTFVQDGDYQIQTFDIAGLADGRPNVYFEFRQNSNNTDQRGGWNVDDFILKRGSLPDYGPCGGCGSSPSFAGAKSAVDNDPCADTGVTISWDPAVSWGAGAAGTYAIYRSTSASFTPGPANLIADGVAGTSYNDVTAPNGSTLYYIVRAENGETTCGGPNNGGAVDTNTLRISASDSTSQSAAGGITSLRVDLVNRAHIRLSWNGVASAASYRVFRSTSPNSGFASIGETSALVFEDFDEGATQETLYYSVKALNACGAEGP
jgi:fibronectin type 3 domain-containing protein